MLKKKLFILLFGIIFVIGITTAFYIGNNQQGIILNVETILPNSMIAVINQTQGVLSVAVDQQNQITMITITPSLFNQLGAGNIVNYVKSLEWKVNDNKASAVNYLDGIPAPLCVKDVGNGRINGIYSVNNSLFVQVNDSRCFVS